MRNPLRIVAAVLVALAASFTLSPVANAHADLDFSTPENGESLDVAPEEVVLTFTEELFNELVEVSILDSAGDLVVATEAEQTPPPGTDVIVPWPADLPPGEYSVAYRVVSEDGHPVTGQVAFSYDATREPVEPTEAPTVEPTAEATSEPTPELISEESPTPEPISEQSTAAESTAQAGEPNSSLIGPLLIGAAVVVGVGVVFSIVMLARSRR